MPDLTIIMWLIAIAATARFWWHSDAVKTHAMGIVARHCQEQGLQLLDQTMVIRGIWPLRYADGNLRIRRRYSFEFSSTGEERYRGTITLAGLERLSLELDPYVIP